MNQVGLVLLFVGMLVVAALVMALLLAPKPPKARDRHPQHNGSSPLAWGGTRSQAPPTPTRRLPYERRRQLLTRAELAFFDSLRAATPEGLVVFPQMRLASIVDVEPQVRREYTHFNRIQAKCVDFVLCDVQTTAPRLVVELDDSSHDRPDRRERDRFVDEVLANAGIPILHIRWQRSYNVAELGAAVRRLLGMGEATSEVGWSQPTADLPLVDTPSAARPPVVVAQMTSPRFADEQVSFQSRYACGRCQREVRQDSRFCSNCGAIL